MIKANDTEYTVYYPPFTMGLWRPIEVEIGLVEDYINGCTQHDL